MIKNKMTNMEVKKRNRNQIYRCIRKNGIVSNPDLAYELKLSLPTVAQNTKELIELGLVKETGELESTGGRKAKALSIAADVRLAAGLDITRNHVGMLLTNLSGEILSYERVTQPFSRSPQYFAELWKRLEQFLIQNGADGERMLGIGISIPGIVDQEKREVTDSHALGIQALALSEIEAHFPYPCLFLNDANAGAYAEGIQGDEQERFFYLSLSNTVGGAFFDHGRLMYGKNFRCGEIGHMTLVPDGRKCYCGKDGCLDAYCNAKRLSEVADGKLESFFEKQKQKDAGCRALWTEYVHHLSLAIHNLHMMLDCDIVLGGYVGSYVSEFLPEIREEAAKRNPFSGNGPSIRSCNYKIGAAAMGAALYVTESFIEQI